MSTPGRKKVITIIFGAMIVIAALCLSWWRYRQMPSNHGLFAGSPEQKIDDSNAVEFSVIQHRRDSNGDLLAYLPNSRDPFTGVGHGTVGPYHVVQEYQNGITTTMEFLYPESGHLAIRDYTPTAHSWPSEHWHWWHNGQLASHVVFHETNHDGITSAEYFDEQGNKVNSEIEMNEQGYPGKSMIHSLSDSMPSN